ncbi:MAG: hypothetical protein KJ588_03700, partial [Gammaproteobacteria bacterium]|nr:hypothetical protein [Gammaproteobacteria bacterium]
SGGLMQRMDTLEKRQITHEIKTDARFDQIFDALENKSLSRSQGVFFEGQIFDAYVFINNLMRQAKHSIVLIDNFIDDSVLIQLAKRPANVTRHYSYQNHHHTTLARPKKAQRTIPAHCSLRISTQSRSFLDH